MKLVCCTLLFEYHLYRGGYAELRCCAALPSTDVHLFDRTPNDVETPPQ